jgi:hypothetical protein
VESWCKAHHTDHDQDVSPRPHSLAPVSTETPLLLAVEVQITSLHPNYTVQVLMRMECFVAAGQLFLED